MKDLKNLEILADGGLLSYQSHFYCLEEADFYLKSLREEISWKQEKGVFGHLLPRLTAWFADEAVNYRYSGITHAGAGWHPLALEIRDRIQQEVGDEFNSVLLNYYRHGQDSMGWHCDDEPELGQNPVIASVSFGAKRGFGLKHKQSKERRNLELEHGSLLVMAGTLQHFWQHGLPKTAKPVGERINLTFRWTRPS